MKDSFELLKDFEGAIVCGDFNFDNSSKSEFEVIQNYNYRDVISTYT